MLIFEVIPVLVGANVFELAKTTFSASVDLLDMTQDALALNITT